MSVKEYKLSEQICLQCMEVIFERSGWTEWFVNPTAGPWKKIRIEGVEDDELFRFRKEEDRPDLIIVHASKQLIMVLEAKDNINGLIRNSGAQIEKSTKVFKAMFEKLRTTLDRHSKSIYGKSSTDTRLICGYLFPMTSNLQSVKKDLEQLSKLHEHQIQIMKEAQLLPHVVFAIASDPSKNLRIYYTSKFLTPELSTKIRELLPNDVKDIANYTANENERARLNHIFFNRTK